MMSAERCDCSRVAPTASYDRLRWTACWYGMDEDNGDTYLCGKKVLVPGSDITIKDAVIDAGKRRPW